MSMPRSPAKYTPRPSGLMEFLATTIDDARAVLDQVPPDVAKVLESVPGYWQRNRRPPLATDRALTGLAMDWAVQLPEHLRPRQTIDRYARVVNAIAKSWPDAKLRAQTFDHLLNDRRIGRRGFPIDIEREITALSRYSRTLP